VRKIETAKTTARVERVIRLVSLRGEAEKLTQLTRAGRGRCPFADHASRDAFGVFKSPAGTELWHCFVCGDSGHVVRFYAKAHGMPFFEALESLEATHGLVDNPRAARKAERHIAYAQAVAAEAEARRRDEILDLQQGLLRIEERRAALGNFTRQLLSLDERDELARIADQWCLLWARFEEVLGVAAPTISEWRAMCREVALDLEATNVALS
jgi:hypothetical protein